MSGGWRRNVRKARHANLRDLCGTKAAFIIPLGCEEPERTGVRALIVAKKPGNAGGAKECRKVDAE